MLYKATTIIIKIITKAKIYQNRLKIPAYINTTSKIMMMNATSKQGFRNYFVVLTHKLLTVSIIMMDIAFNLQM